MLLDEALPSSRPGPRITSTPQAPPAETSAPVAKAPPKQRRFPPVTATGAAVASVVVVVGLWLLPARSPYSSTEARALSEQYTQHYRARVASAAVEGAVVSIARTVSPGGEARVLVLRDSVPQLFPLPDHTLVVTTGLLARLETDAQLAAVVAHVRAHEALGHIDGIDEREGPGVPDALRIAATATHSSSDERRADDHAVDVLGDAGWKLSALGRAEALLRADAEGWSRLHVRDIPAHTDSEGQERPDWYAQFVLAQLKASGDMSGMPAAKPKTATTAPTTTTPTSTAPTSTTGAAAPIPSP